MPYNWDKLRKRYVEGTESVDAIAKDEGTPSAPTIRRRCRQEGWVQLRKDYRASKNEAKGKKSPPSYDWDTVRQRYITGEESIAQIAEDSDTPPLGSLTRRSGKEGWTKLRTIYRDQLKARTEEAIAKDEQDRRIRESQKKAQEAIAVEAIIDSNEEAAQAVDTIQTFVDTASRIMDREKIIRERDETAQILQGLGHKYLSLMLEDLVLMRKNLPPKNAVGVAMRDKPPSARDMALLMKVTMELQNSAIALDDERFAIATIAGEDSSSANVRFTELMTSHRDYAVERWYGRVDSRVEVHFANDWPLVTGGEWFLKWAREHHRVKDGGKLEWTEPYLEGFYLLMGSPWIEQVIIEKPSQVGYSECMVALSAFLLSEVRLTGAVGFESKTKLEQDMAPRFQKTFDFIEPVRDLREKRFQMTGRKDTDTKTRLMTVGGVELTLFPAAVGGGTSGQERQASSALSSWDTKWALCDEVELWPLEALSLVDKRFGASKLETKFKRLGSTPGHEGGFVDTLVGDCNYIFAWWVQCPHCGEGQLVHPFGNFLKPHTIADEAGVEETVYIDPAGRPYDWFTKTPKGNFEERIKHAYVGCLHCGEELTRETLDGGEFRSKVGDKPESAILATWAETESLRECCSRSGEVISLAALRIPRLASHLFNPSKIIEDLNVSRNPADEIQQGLGLAVSVGSGKISLPKIQKCIGIPLPDWCANKYPDVVVLGCDQGAAKNYVMVKSYWLADGKTVDEQWVNAIARVDHWGTVEGFDGVYELAQHYRASIIGIDGEPEKQLATEFSGQHPPKNYRDIRPKLKWATVEATVQKLKGILVKILDKLGEEESGQRLQELVSESDGILGLGVTVTVQANRRLMKLSLNFFHWSTEVPPAEKALVASDIAEAIKLTKSLIPSSVFTFDQVHLKGDDFRITNRNVQGDKVPVISLHRTAGLDWVRNRIYRKQQIFPKTLKHEPGNHGNLIVHYLSSDRTTQGIWTQASAIPDHWLHADNFCEAGLLASLHHEKETTIGMGWG